MVQVFEDLQAIPDNLMARVSRQIHQNTNATICMFRPGTLQAPVHLVCMLFIFVHVAFASAVPHIDTAMVSME
jgi:hypothetical protein